MITFQLLVPTALLIWFSGRMGLYISPTFHIKMGKKSQRQKQIERLKLKYWFSLDSLVFFQIPFQYQLRSIGILGLAIATILHLRLSIPGPTTQFSTADNPTAKVNTVLTRFYTFLYLPVFNFKLLVYPHTLSFDWGMDAIPRITSLFDTRNIISLMFYSALCRIVLKCMSALRKATPKVNSVKRLGRTIQKRKHQTQHPKMFDDEASTVHPNQLWDIENSCSVCQQGLKRRHASNAVSTYTAASLCATPMGFGNKKQVISLSPLKKYIRNNNANLNKLKDFNSNDNNNDELFNDLNNNSVCDNIVVPSVTVIAPALHQPIKHLRESSQKHSVKSKLASVANYVSMKSAEKCVKNVKLNSASSILISIAMLTLPFLPASNLFFYVGFVVAERILYLPSVGYCLLIGLGLGKLINFKVHVKGSGAKAKHKIEALRHHNVRSMATILFLIILISASSLQTMRRNRDWRDEESLYRSAIRINPPKGNFSQLVLASRNFRFTNSSNKSYMQNLVYCLGEHFEIRFVSVVLFFRLCTYDIHKLQSLRWGHEERKKENKAVIPIVGSFQPVLGKEEKIGFCRNSCECRQLCVLQQT